MSLVLPAATVTFQEWYFRVGEKEHLHHAMAQTDGHGWVSNLRDVPASPSTDATLQAALGRGKSRSQIAQRKPLHAEALNRAFFFLISTPGRQGWVSAGCQPHWHSPLGEEGRGGRAKAEPDHPLSAGKCCRGRLPSCERARLRNARGPGDIFIRKEEENPGKQSQKEGGKVCENKSGLIAGSFVLSYSH